MDKYTCPCCGYKALEEPAWGICDICYWENDPNVWEKPDEKSLANSGLTLREAQANFIKIKACDEAFLEEVHPPKGEEKSPNWRPFLPPKK